MLEKIKVMFRHNQFLVLAVVVVIALGIWLIGCESSTQSPFNPDVKVTRDQLELQVKNYTAQIELAYKDLDKQDLFKQELFNLGVVVAQGGTIDPVGAGITLLSILGIGACVDNRRKDAVIKTQQKQINGGK